MNDIFFYKGFIFNDYSFNKHHYTDNRHGVASHYLAYMIKGNCRIVTANDELFIKPGDLFYIPKGLPYQSFWDSEDDIKFLSFGFDFFPESDIHNFYLQKIECDESIINEIKNIPIKKTIDSMTIGAFYSALSLVLPLLKENKTKKNYHVILEKAKSYIYDNPNCNVGDIARHCLISESALYHIFKKYADTTPNALIQKLRCEKGVILLKTTDKSVQQISDDLGFSSTSYFRKILYLNMGKTPREIRKNSKNI